MHVRLTLALSDAEDSRQLAAAARNLGAQLEIWRSDSPLDRPRATDAVAISKLTCPVLRDALGEDGWPRPPIVLVAVGASSDLSRRAILEGCAGVVDPALAGWHGTALALYAAAYGSAPLPVTGLVDLARCLEPPPTDLTDLERDFLRLAATGTIVEAGAHLGYSRRQAQRRFANIRSRLGLMAPSSWIVAAARWGLLEAEFGPGRAAN